MASLFFDRCTVLTGGQEDFFDIKTKGFKDRKTDFSWIKILKIPKSVDIKTHATRKHKDKEIKSLKYQNP